MLEQRVKNIIKIVISKFEIFYLKYFGFIGFGDAYVEITGVQ